MHKKLIIFFSFFLFALIVIIGSGSLPMFWDMTFYSHLACNIYDNNFSLSSLYLPADADNGNPPLYSLYLALLWSFFGKSLLVAHLAALPFIAGIIWEINKLVSFFKGSDKLWILSLLILIAEPTFSTQVLLAGFDLAFVFLFLLSLNSILNNKRTLLAVAVLFIGLINLRGLYFVCSIFVIDIFYNKFIQKNRFSISLLLPYLLSFIVLLLWLYFHKIETGWHIISASNKKLLFIPDIERFFRNIFYVIWKIADFGRIILIIIIITGFITLYKRNKRWTNEMKLITLIIIAPILIYILLFGWHSYPVAHRHFLHLFIILVVFSVYIIELISKLYLKTIIYAGVIFVLYTGNNWYYPERFGNGWDSSLKCIDFFPVYRDIDTILKTHNIKPEEVGSKYPFQQNYKYAYLDNRNFCFADLSERSIDSVKYIFYTNVSNNFTDVERRYLNTAKQVVYKYKKGRVEVILFK